MKTKEQIESALNKYQSMLQLNKGIMEFEEDFMKANSFMNNRDAYVASVHKYHEAELNVYACEKLIKNCKWILDIE